MNNEELLDKIQGLRLKKALIIEVYDGEIKKLTDQLGLMMNDMQTLKTDSATAYWQRSTKVEVKDWVAVMNFVYANKAFDILQRRISPAQLKARLDAGASIKGVTISEGEQTLVIKGRKEE